jgi:hypothetical protein
MAEIDSGKADSDTLDISTIYILVSRAAVEIGRLQNANSDMEDEIERLRDANSDMGWRLNPDRMGGQFTQDEIDRALRGPDVW